MGTESARLSFPTEKTRNFSVWLTEDWSTVLFGNTGGKEVVVFISQRVLDNWIMTIHYLGDS
jgi:hypothetical protein